MTPREIVSHLRPMVTRGTCEGYEASALSQSEDCARCGRDASEHALAAAVALIEAMVKDENP